MEYKRILVETRDALTTVTLNHPQRRNPLSVEMMTELAQALRDVGASNSRGVLLKAAGPVFCSGHDFADMAGRNLNEMRTLLRRCAELMVTFQSIPQPVVASVQGLATAAGCQLVATCDLVVASEEARFATPGGMGGWFCTTPMVAVTRVVGRKRALELLLTGEAIDARTAAEWGLVNRVVPAEELDPAAQELLRLATRGSPLSKGIGKQAFYAQVDLDQEKAYAYALEVMASTALTADAQETMRAFLEKRLPSFTGR
jgi:enoyl-CoA hydratase/carnithine racemase